MENLTQLFPCDTRICLDKFKDLFCSLTTSMTTFWTFSLTTFLSDFFDHLLTDFPFLQTAGLRGEIEVDMEDGIVDPIALLLLDIEAFEKIFLALEIGFDGRE